MLGFFIINKEKNMKSKFLLVFSLTVNTIWSVGEAGAIFLLIAPGAGPQGTGEAQVAKADDAYASYYNPAGLGFLEGREVAGMHVNWLPNLANDLYYEFITYRHHIKGLGTVGGHLIYLNLGEQIGMDEFGNPTDNWKSYMGAISGSFGTRLSERSSLGFNFKVFHQKLSDAVVAGEEGKGFSTDFAFDIGYLKKFKKSIKKIKKKRKRKAENLFEEIAKLYDRQNDLSEDLLNVFDDNLDGLDYVDEQSFLLEDLENIKQKFRVFSLMDTYVNIDNKIVLIISKLEQLINSFVDLEEKNVLPSELDGHQVFSIEIIDKVLFNLLELEQDKISLMEDLDIENIEELDDKFNFGFSISNIGPKIDFVDVDQADPSPTNMRLGIFAQLYNDDYNKINLLFDANKLLVTRYPMMDWDGDGFVGGYDKSGYNIGLKVGEYNSKGEKEWDSKGYIDDPWYKAIVTAWLDDWYLGGDIDYDGDAKIGGWAWDLSNDSDNDGVPDVDELVEDEEGIYNHGDENGKVEIEKGSSKNRSFDRELKEMVYNLGLEYWYTDAFALRTGYIYDFEGKIFNPTFGAGIRLLQYGFDFGYTAGQQGHPRANTMFFSINIKI